MKKKAGYFICLGAGNHQIPLIHAAKEIGYKVVVIDQNLMAPGMKFSDIQIECSITDFESIIQKISEALLPEKIIGVATRSYGKATSSASEISKFFNILSAKHFDADLFLNKRKLKNLLKKNGILIPTTYSWKNKKDKKILLNASMPLIARPAEGHGKLGLKLINSKKLLIEFLNKNKKDNESLLIESMIQGKEYTVLGLVKNGVYQSISITNKTTSTQEPLFIEIEHIWPSDLSKKSKNNISLIMQKIVKSTRIENSPIVAEFLISESDDEEKIFLVECTPETGGEYLADVMVKKLYANWNYFKEIVHLNSISKEANLQSWHSLKNEQQSIIIRYIPQQSGILRNIQIPEWVQNHEDLIFFKQLTKNGTPTSMSGGNSDRLLVFALASSEKSRKELLLEADQISASITIEYETR